MRNMHTKRLSIRSEKIRQLANTDLSNVRGGEIASGSQGGYSGPCPPPKNGEGSGCVSG